jgi:hypothetical protein
MEYKGSKVNAFWLKMRGSETWIILISSDTDLNFTNVMKYYQNLNIIKC